VLKCKTWFTARWLKSCRQAGIEWVSVVIVVCVGMYSTTVPVLYVVTCFSGCACFGRDLIWREHARYVRYLRDWKSQSLCADQIQIIISGTRTEPTKQNITERNWTKQHIITERKTNSWVFGNSVSFSLQYRIQSYSVLGFLFNTTK
jgi:hypothetical protein